MLNNGLDSNEQSTTTMFVVNINYLMTTNMVCKNNIKINIVCTYITATFRKKDLACDTFLSIVPFTRHFK